MSVHQIAPSPCPYCKFADATHATMLDSDQAPTPGDFVVCLRCSNLCVYSEHMILRTPTELELTTIAGEPGLRRMMFFVASYRANVAATEEEMQALIRAATDLGGICSLTELATKLEWPAHKVFGVMKKVEDQGRGFALPGKGLEL